MPKKILATLAISVTVPLAVANLLPRLKAAVEKAGLSR